MAPPLRFNATFGSFRTEQVSDGQGGWTPKLVPHLEGVRCRVRPWLTEEQLIARQAGIRISHIMYVPAGTDVRRGDVVEVRGMTADVVGVREPSEPHHLMVDLEERQSGTTGHARIPFDPDGPGSS